MLRIPALLLMLGAILLSVPGGVGAAAMEPSLKLEYSTLPVNKESRVFALVELKSSDSLKGPSKGAPFLNVALVIDHSGSMGAEQKLSLAKEAASRLVKNLGPRDRVAVVDFDERVNVLSPSAPVQSSHLINRMIEMLTPGGPSNIAAAMRTAADGLVRSAEGHCISVMILLADGQANIGQTRKGEIARLASEIARRGIGVSTIGLGDEADDGLLERIAREGGGRHRAITRREDIEEVCRAEIVAWRESVTRDTSLRCVASGAVSRVVVYDFPAISENRTTEIPLRNFQPGEHRELLIRFDVKNSGAGSGRLGSFTLSYYDLTARREVEKHFDASVGFSADPARVTASANRDVVTRAALISTNERLEDYLKLAEQGYQRQALRRIESLLERLRGAHDLTGDPRLEHKIQSLELEASLLRDSSGIQKEVDVAVEQDRLRSIALESRNIKGRHVLREGLRGYQVRRLQAALKKDGSYAGPVDGAFGRELTEAVRRYQSHNHLTPDGIAGPPTLQMLGLY